MYNRARGGGGASWIIQKHLFLLGSVRPVSISIETPDETLRALYKVILQVFAILLEDPELERMRFVIVQNLLRRSLHRIFFRQL